MARITAWWLPRSNEIERCGKVRDRAGRKEVGGMKRMRKRRERRTKRGIMEEKRGRMGTRSGWRFLNMPLWSTRKRKSEMSRGESD